MRLRQSRPILIADDDAPTREGLAEFFREFGYDVLVSRDGQEAMDLLLGGVQPGVLVIDLAMPHVAGDALLKYLQSDPDLRLVPVVVITAAPERLGRAVADAVLAKPVDLNALLALVRRLRP